MEVLSLLLILGQKTVLAGVLAVEGAGLENRGTGFLSLLNKIFIQYSFNPQN